MHPHRTISRSLDLIEHLDRTEKESLEAEEEEEKEFASRG